MKNTKKLLAILLCLALIIPTVVLNTTVTAETETYKFNVLKTGFEEDTSKDSSYYGQASNGYADGDRCVKIDSTAGIGNNGSNHAMKMGYNNNPSDTNYRPVFSLRCSNIYNGQTDTSSFRVKHNYTYTVSVYYKAETINSRVDLYVREFSGTLANQPVDSNSAISTKKIAQISSTSDSYIYAEVTFTTEVTSQNRNLIFLLKPTDYTNVAGTTIYIDDITVTEHQTLDSQMGTQDFESITTVGNSVGDTTLTGRYPAGGTFAISTEQNHTEGGSKSVKMNIKAGANSGAGRPRMILKVGNNDFVATKGESYVVSFWVYAPEAISTFNWYIYSVVMDVIPQSREGQAEIERSNVALTAGWNKITQSVTITGFNSSEHNFLQLGLTDSNATGSSYIAKDFYLDDIKIQEVAQLVTSTPVYQDFSGIGTISGQAASKSNTNGGSAQVANTGSKSGVQTPQFYIPGENEYTRLCGAYGNRYRLTTSVYSANDITAKIRWCGTTTLAGSGFNFSTNHRVIAEQTVELAAGEWTDLTLETYINNIDIFVDKTVYFTLGATIADSGDSTTAYTFLFDDISVRQVTKPVTPDAPVVAECSEDSITLQPLSGGEYSIDGTNWQDSNVFNDLTPWTEYTIYQRKKATETAIASDRRQLAYMLVLNGDLNMDSDINASDITLLIKVLIGAEAEIDVEYSELAEDVNADSSVDLRDLVTIKKMLSVNSVVDAYVPIG